MAARRLTALIERQGEWFVSLCPELDIASQGRTVEEARANLAEALELFFETASEDEIQRREAAARPNGTQTTTRWHAPSHWPNPTTSLCRTRKPRNSTRDSRAATGCRTKWSAGFSADLRNFGA